MKILNLDSYYDPALKNFYKTNPDVADLSYDMTLKRLMQMSFGSADSYSKNLNLLGHNAQDIIINDKTLQKKWLKEQGGRRFFDWADSLRLPYTKLTIKTGWQEAILEKQILEFRPDVLYCQSLFLPGSKFINNIRKQVPLFVVGQIASPTQFDKEFLSAYDLILSSFPHFVERFRAMGINSHYFRIGFEDSILKSLRKKKLTYDVSFVGGLSKTYYQHTSTVVAAATDFWGYGAQYQNFPPEIAKKYRGEAWGMDMYDILFNSKITLNRHINVAEDHANNMRLYEATGVGTMLITDHKSDLNKLFVPGKEVETYESQKELEDKVKYYLAHDKERERVAKAGQKRTLKDHTYRIRMQELATLLNKNLHSATKW
jgi:UDP-N-acetylglucosamine:LPS N-acetylglucosamine transferase